MRPVSVARTASMTFGITDATALGSMSAEGTATVTDERRDQALLNLSPRHVLRPRLTELLDDARAQALILEASAGYGKTSLAVE